MRRVGFSMLAAFFILLVGLPIAQRVSSASALALFDAFYRSGALVFGGGHVVRRLREAFVGPGWIGDDAFLAGYGGAQALPGPRLPPTSAPSFTRRPTALPARRSACSAFFFRAC